MSKEANSDENMSVFEGGKQHVKNTLVSEGAASKLNNHVDPKSTNKETFIDCNSNSQSENEETI